MKAIVFGGSEFIGSHVVEQLHLGGHQVTVAVRETSDITLLKSLGVNVRKVDFANPLSIQKVIEGHEVVYNCTADANLNVHNNLDAPVEIKLTKALIEAAAVHDISRFIQLSTIVIYDFKSNEPIDESYIPQSESPTQKVFLERERVIQETGEKGGIETIILRPASTIGRRDVKSFFSRLFAAYIKDQFPMVGTGDTKVSLIDTRDIGRAMVWLGTYEKPKDDNGIYLLKGFDTTWNQLKKELDLVTGRNAAIAQLSTSEQTLMVKNFIVNRIWNDTKIKNLGFNTIYSLTDAVETSTKDLLGMVN